MHQKRFTKKRLGKGGPSAFKEVTLFWGRVARRKDLWGEKFRVDKREGRVTTNSLSKFQAEGGVARVGLHGLSKKIRKFQKKK